MGKHDLTPAAMRRAIDRATDEAVVVFAACGWAWAGGIPDANDLRDRYTGLVWSARRHAAKGKDGYAFAASGRLWVTVRRDGKTECLHLGIELAEAEGRCVSGVDRAAGDASYPRPHA
jgi:hypothetical protein